MICIFSKHTGLIGWIVMVLVTSIFSLGVTQDKIDLTDLSLEELMNIEVKLVSRRAEKLSETAAAMTVITQEDIRCLGVTSIPEVLCMVPGIQVAHIDANKWAVTIRGFNGRFANKLLILLDGRSVYSLLYPGVFWEIQDVSLEDVERIEIIRGPGAALWGSNAVNGVINIITKHAKDTQGAQITTGGGSWEKGFLNCRYGGAFNNDLHYRVYTKYYQRGPFVDQLGKDAADQSEGLHGGFRFDWDKSDRSHLAVLGSLYKIKYGQTFRLPGKEPPYIQQFNANSKANGGHILSRWEFRFSDQSDMAFQMIFNRTEMQDQIIYGQVNSFDVDFQHRMMFGQFHEIMWGVGYRLTRDHYQDTDVIDLSPQHRSFDLFSVFVQDNICLFRDRLNLTLGSKFEHNEFTGFEVQPNFRLMWKPNLRHRIWGDVSRAVRMPSRSENEVELGAAVIPPDDPLNPFDVPFLIRVIGNEDIKSEVLITHEIGYRVLLSKRISMDVTTFFNRYQNLRSIEFNPEKMVVTSLPVVVPVDYRNETYGQSYGIEFCTNFWLFNWWRLYGSYSFIGVELWNENIELEIEKTITDHDEASPKHQAYLQSIFEIGNEIELFLGIRYVDAIPWMELKHHYILNSRLGWKLNRHLQLSIVGKNLIDDRRFEFKPELRYTLPTSVIRSVYGSVTFSF